MMENPRPDASGRGSPPKGGGKLQVLIAAAVLLLGVILFFRFSPGSSQYLWDMSSGGKWLLPLVAVAALIDSVNPCAFSVLLLTIAFLFSLGKLRGQILKVGSFYILGLFVVYVLIGLGILRALSFFGVPHFMARAGALLLIALGVLNLINHFFPSFPVRLGIPRAAHAKMGELMEQASLPTAFLLGALVGLCEFPCTGGPYLMILGLLHDKATYLTGLGYLGLYNLIFVLPLVVILGIASNQTLLQKVQDWKKRETGSMHLWGGLAMVVLGLLILAL